MSIDIYAILYKLYSNNNYLELALNNTHLLFHASKWLMM
jgi:hypothetical protein